MQREPIYSALFALVKDLPGFKTTSRRPRLPQEVAGEELPALFQEQLPEMVAHQGQGLPSEYRLATDLIIYIAEFNPHKPNDVPSSRLNPLIDAVCAALAPEEDEEDQTLGGLVEYCRISGQIEVNEGLETGKPLAIIPVEILAV